MVGQAVVPPVLEGRGREIQTSIPLSPSGTRRRPVRDEHPMNEDQNTPVIAEPALVETPVTSSESTEAQPAAAPEDENPKEDAPAESEGEPASAE